jgi:nicotinate-nucleotide adenylyltransferase
LIKAGVFGGTFNPVHTGHLILAEFVCEKLNLDKIIFIPTKNPPHKSNKEIIDGYLRIEMLKIAIKGNKRFTVSDIEIKNSDNLKSYTIDTINKLNKINRIAKPLNLIIGYDSYLELNTWKEPDKICKYSNVIVLKRPDYNNTFDNKFKNKVVFLESPLISISSTQIRNKIRNRKSIKYLVPERVENFIIKNKLYI